MIYIFKACDGCCSGFGKACDQCCKDLGQCCDPLCKVMDRPLGGYVLMAGLMNVPAAVCSVLALTDEGVTGCTKHPLSAFCGVNCLLAIGHTAFALYLQRQLVRGLAVDPLTGTTQSAPSSGVAPTVVQELSAKELMSRAGHIVLYDVGFCFYVFVFGFSFIFQNIGFGWISGCRGVDSALPWFSAVLLLLFAFGAVGFAMLWYCALACDDCCGSFGARPVSTGAQPQNRQNTGLVGSLLKVIMGGGMSRQQQPPQQPPTVMGAPVYAAGGQQAYGGQHQQPYGGQQQRYAPPAGQYYPGTAAPPPQAPQPSGTQQAKQVAQQAAASGLAGLGQGMQKAGQWLSGAGKK
mmetsp:Transcript_82706/g.184531  ORF Transcript_82706/g.184531 Transcript_82706/m.184531 type:complete len:349 (+) Transcript_82706:101-1147(+)